MSVDLHIFVNIFRPKIIVGEKLNIYKLFGYYILRNHNILQTTNINHDS